MTDQEWDVLFKEAISEDFAWFLRTMRERNVKYAPRAFKEVKKAHFVAFLRGLVWQRRRDAAAGVKPA